MIISDLFMCEKIFYKTGHVINFYNGNILYLVDTTLGFHLRICLELLILTKKAIGDIYTVLYYFPAFKSLKLSIGDAQDWRTGIEMTSTAVYDMIILIPWGVLFPKTPFECVSSVWFILDLQHYVVPLLLFYWSWFKYSSSCYTVLYPVFYVCI